MSSLTTAVRHLRRADPTLGRVIDRVGACRFEARAEGSHFDAIIRAIIYQQLSGLAAATILRRMLGLFGDRSPTSAELLATSDEQLRSVGVSRQKIGYLRDLATRAASGELPVDTLHDLDDDALIASLTTVKGVGTWTAHMFLMFRLGRPNVLPALDLGVRKAVQHAYGLRSLPTTERVDRIGMAWHPYRTIASWYLWRSLELDGAPGARPRKKKGAEKHGVKGAKKRGVKMFGAKRSSAKKSSAKKSSAGKSGAKRSSAGKRAARPKAISKRR